MTRRKRPIVMVDDYVLFSGSRASMPGDWCLGRVLWVGSNDLLVHRDNAHGSNWRDVVHIDHVRGVAPTIADLVEFRNTCRETAAALQKRVREAEDALGRARDAVWAALDAIGVSAPPKEKPGRGRRAA